jgi:hypothetical protein
MYSGQIFMTLHPIVYQVCDGQHPCLVFLKSNVVPDPLLVLADTKMFHAGEIRSRDFHKSLNFTKAQGPKVNSACD